MKLKSQDYLKSRIFILSPYVGVIIGLYIFRNAFLAIMIYHAGIILSLVFVKSDYNFRDLFRFKSRILLVLSVLICLLAGIAILILWDFIKPAKLDLLYTMTELGLIGIWKPIFLIYFSVIHPFLEESYWRFHLPSSEKFISFDDLFFALYHTLVLHFFLKSWAVILCFVGLFFIAAGWRYLKERRGDNFVVLLSHAVADFSIMSAVFLLY
jgi:hypothetical protein